MACRNDEPARSALAMSVMVSASRLLKALSRSALRRLSQKRGRQKPTTPPMSRKSGLPRVGKKGLSRNMRAGTPSVQPTRIMRLGGLEHEVRAGQLAGEVGAPVALLDDAC